MKSDDYGATWETISPDLTRNDPSTEAPTGGPIDLDQSGAEIYPYVSALAVSPLDGNLIWAGSSDGLVHVTTDGGKSWSMVTPPTLPKWSHIGSIEPSHVDKGTAYLTANRYMWDDFTPYVFKTTDFGHTWTAMTTGLPADQYVTAVRQDPKDADLLFLGSKNTLYVSFDRGAHWQPLTLNLPQALVRDVAINNRQGSVVVATHGRAFWVLDNLALLEQLTKQPAIASSEAAIFAPQQAWLSHAYGAPEYPGAAKGAGQNPPFGATVYFHVPATYDGKTPVKLEFTDANGKLIRSFDLHLKAKKKEKKVDMSNLLPAERKAKAEEQLTAIEPGMNRFQWNLRYADATEVTGFYVPIAAGGMEDEVSGPVVAPGTYHAVLDYGGKQSEQAFTVALDPRIKTSQADLDARLALQMKVHETLDALDRTINEAIAAREQLKVAMVAQRANVRRAHRALQALDDAIGAVVQLDVQSSEGTLLHEAKLRSHLAYLQAGMGLAYAHPTTAQAAVFKELAEEAKAGEVKLARAISSAHRAIRRK